MKSTYDFLQNAFKKYLLLSLQKIMETYHRISHLTQKQNRTKNKRNAWKSCNISLYAPKAAILFTTFFFFVSSYLEHEMTDSQANNKALDITI